jgi:hypothetical protein
MGIAGKNPGQIQRRINTIYSLIYRYKTIREMSYTVSVIVIRARYEINEPYKKPF